MHKDITGTSRILIVLIIVIIIVAIIAGLFATGHLRVRIGRRTATTSSAQSLYQLNKLAENTSPYKSMHLEKFAIVPLAKIVG